MPFTPFHLGPGLLLKAAAPRRVSLVAFAAAQVAVDLEPLWRLVTGTRPVHGPLHSLLVATPLGLAAGAAVGWLLPRLFPRTCATVRTIREEGAYPAALLGGAIGGASHPILDGLMHADLRPFWPFTMENPLLGLVSPWTVSLGCVFAGVLGMMLWFANSSRRGRFAERDTTRLGGPTQ